MKIAVIGAGAIGGLVAGYLKAEGQDVILIAHPNSAKAIKENGLEISGARGNSNIRLEVSEKLKSKPELVILATKTQDIEAALIDNLEFIKDALVLTAQNGLQADNIVAKYIPKERIISSIVMFGATSLKPGKIVHNFEGNWILGKAFSAGEGPVAQVAEVMNKIFPAVVSAEIKGMKCLKVFVNANNCIPAILGLSMQEAFSDADISAISISIWKEGMKIIDNAGISLVSLPDFPLERLKKLTTLATADAAKIYSGIMMNLSKEPLYGSILQSIKRGKVSEIDYINGEFVRLAKENNIKAPLNEKLVDMVHKVEKTNKFFSKEDLINSTRELLN